jgi:hypothetical protein
VRAGLLHAEADGVGRAGPQAGEGVGGHLEADLDVAVLGRHVRVMVILLRRDLEDKVPGQRAGGVPAQGDEGVRHCQREDLDVEQLKKSGKSRQKLAVRIRAGNVSFSSVFRACFNQFLSTLSSTVSFYAPQDSFVTKDNGIEACASSYSLRISTANLARALQRRYYSVQKRGDYCPYAKDVQNYGKCGKISKQDHLLKPLFWRICV